MNGRENLIDHFTGCYYLNPVKCEEEFTYEKQFIIRWLKKKSVSPYSRKEISIKNVVDDLEMKERVEKYLEENPDERKEQYVETFENSELFKNKDFERIMKTTSFSIHDFKKVKFSTYDFFKFPFEVQKHIVDNFIDINEFNENEMNLLLFACRACGYNEIKKYDFIKYLLSKGAKVNFETRETYTHFGESHGIDENFTPLNILLDYAEESEENIKILKLLLDNGADIYRRDGYEDVCIMWSSSLTFTKMILNTLEDDYEKWKYLHIENENTILNKILKHSHEFITLEHVKYLISINKEIFDDHTIIYMILNSNLDIIKEFIDKVSIYDVFYAVRRGNIKILEMIFEHHRDKMYKERLLRICELKEGNRYNEHNINILVGMAKKGFLSKEEILSRYKNFYYNFQDNSYKSLEFSLMKLRCKISSLP